MKLLVNTFDENTDTAFDKVNSTFRPFSESTIYFVIFFDKYLLILYNDLMLEPVLKAAGLNPKEAEVYESILRSGKETPASLLKKVQLKRGDLYNVLRGLEKRKLIYSLPNTKKLTFVVSDPGTIEQAVRANERGLEEAKERLSFLYSLYNLGIGKPGVRFTQGLEGIKELFNDTLTAKTEILSYADVDGWIKHLPKYMVWYAAERRRRKIKERAIIPDTPAARQYMGDYNKEFTAIKFVPHQKFKFSLEMNIYDNKVVYVTFDEPFIGVLIEDKNIADTQRAIFEFGWEYGENN